MSERGKCFNPESTYIKSNAFDDDIFPATLKVSIDGERLRNEQVSMFYAYNIFDFSDVSQPFKTQIKWSREFLIGRKNFFDLTLHKLELFDNIYSPFKSSKNQSYLSLKETGSEQGEEYESKREVYIRLSDDIVIETRTRYTVWDLLGDVGGFNDGLLLLC